MPAILTGVEVDMMDQLLTGVELASGTQEERTRSSVYAESL